mmetsp:Transcript_37268/g.58239  ORF Transcript_37268/g.58239 Transcript_37268/m.58239 type:complete len:260 (+) Transcript_37268:118-897(+)
MMATDAGMSLFISDSEGSPIRSNEFDSDCDAKGIKRQLDEGLVQKLIGVGRLGIKRYYQMLKAQPEVYRDERFPWMETLASEGVEEVEVSLDGDVVPRIEVRGVRSSVIYVGIPASFANEMYGEALEPFCQEVEWMPTGRLSVDCLPKGVGKQRVVDFLLNSGKVKRGHTLCLGDRPTGNDKGLTLWHTNGIPFVSVCENQAQVPGELLDLHVGGNANGAASFLQTLVDTMRKEAKADSPLSAALVQKWVEKLSISPCN